LFGAFFFFGGGAPPLAPPGPTRSTRCVKNWIVPSRTKRSLRWIASDQRSRSGAVDRARRTARTARTRSRGGPRAPTTSAATHMAAAANAEGDDNRHCEALRADWVERRRTPAAGRAKHPSPVIAVPCRTTVPCRRRADFHEPHVVRDPISNEMNYELVTQPAA
jgi:hypothetical protein